MGRKIVACGNLQKQIFVKMYVLYMTKVVVGKIKEHFCGMRREQDSKPSLCRTYVWGQLQVSA